MINCAICEESFYQRPNRIKKGSVYCSRQCSSINKLSEHPEAFCDCFFCGKHFRARPSTIRTRPTHKRFCSRKCFEKYQKEIHFGTKPDSGGYFYLTHRGDRVRIHRYLMEKYLGRKLESAEHIHHKNGNKKDNSIKNLEILSESSHHKLHPRQREAGGAWLKCRECGKERWYCRYSITKYYKNDPVIMKRYRCMKCGGRLKGHGSWKKCEDKVHEIA